MSPKSVRKAQAIADFRSNPLIIDHSSRHEQSKRNLPRLDYPNDTRADSAIHTQDRGDGGSATSTSTLDDGEADGEASDGDAAEADEEDDGGGGDGDALAPSDYNTKGHNDQAGLTKDNTNNGVDLGGLQELGAPALHDQPPVTKRTKRTKPSRRSIRNSSAECDSDDVYNKVDFISDSDEDESAVENFEDKNVNDSEGVNEISPTSATFPGALSETEDWEGFDLESGLFLDEFPFFDEQYGRTQPSVLSSEMDIFKSTSVFEGFSPPPQMRSPRRVRFKEPVFLPSDSDMVSDDEDISGLGHPSQHQSVLADEITIYRNEEINDEDVYSSCGSSSGYETDYGETTDEEDIPASATKAPQSLLRNPSPSSLDAATQLTPASAQSPFKIPGGYRQGPRMGSFKTDPTKNIAVTDANGVGVVIFCAKRPVKPACSTTSTAMTSPTISQPMLPAGPSDNEIDPSGFSSQVSIDPMLGSGSDALSSALQNGAGGDHLDCQLFDPSVFVPADSVGKMVANFGEDDQDDDEPFLNIEDFIHFSDEVSDDGAGETGNTDALQTSPISVNDDATSPTQLQLKTPSPDNTHYLMEHFDKGLVSAFRLGQPHHQQYARRTQGGMSLNSHAIKGGRQAAANSPMSPQRKRKLSDGFGPRPTFGIAAKRRIVTHH